MSDTINVIELIIGGLMIPFLALILLGDGNFLDGVGKLLTDNPAKLNSIGMYDSSIPWAVLVTGLLFNNLFYWTTNQSIIQRTLGAKNLAEGQKGVLYAGLFKVFGMFFWYYLESSPFYCMTGRLRIQIWLIPSLWWMYYLSDYPASWQPYFSEQS